MKISPKTPFLTRTSRQAMPETTLAIGPTKRLGRTSRSSQNDRKLPRAPPRSFPLPAGKVAAALAQLLVRRTRQTADWQALALAPLEPSPDLLRAAPGLLGSHPGVQRREQLRHLRVGRFRPGLLEQPHCGAVADQTAEDGERDLGALAANPVQGQHEHNLEAAKPGFGERLAEHLTVLRAAIDGDHLEHVIAGDLEALPLRPLTQLVELVGRLLLGLGEPVPDRAPGGHNSSGFASTSLSPTPRTAARTVAAASLRRQALCSIMETCGCLRHQSSPSVREDTSAWLGCSVSRARRTAAPPSRSPPGASRARRKFSGSMNDSCQV